MSESGDMAVNGNGPKQPINWAGVIGGGLQGVGAGLASSGVAVPSPIAAVTGFTGTELLIGAGLAAGALYLITRR